MEKSPLILGNSHDPAKRGSPRRRCLNPFAANQVEWSVHVQGNCVQFRSKDRNYEYIPCPVRGKIGPFSKASRMRMLRFLNRVDWLSMGTTLFITLTYPDSVVRRTYLERSVDRARFIRYLELFRGKHLPIIWRVEWKARKTGALVGQLMPHWHLLVCGCEFIPKEFVRESWRKCISLPVGPLCTDVREVTGELGAVKYIAKYLSKQATLDISAYHNSGFEFGRHWGTCRKAEFVMGVVVANRKLRKSEIEILRQYAVGSGGAWAMEHDVGFTVFSADAVRLWREVDKCS